MARPPIIYVILVASGVLVGVAVGTIRHPQPKASFMNLTTQKVIRVGLVGHCSPDSSHLTMAVSAAIPGAKVIRVVDDAGTGKLLADGVDLLLVNRAMDPGYSEAIGIDYIRKLKASHPDVKMMLVSNFPDAHEAAIKEGALPGFGKNDWMSAGTKKLLQDAVK